MDVRFFAFLYWVHFMGSAFKEKLLAIWDQNTSKYGAIWQFLSHLMIHNVEVNKMWM